jgi:beta-barrel assembly-enhancing protease
MKRFLLQFLVIVSAFLLLWVLLSQVNFRGIIKLEKRLESAENKLGEVVWKAFKREYREITDREITDFIERKASIIFDANELKPESIEIHILRNTDVNAFALPGRRIVFFSGLIDFCNTPEEFLGVLAHETAHIEARHVTKKLSKEIGLGIVFALMTGNYGTEIARSLLKILTSTAYDRTLEREADRIAMDYMINSGINPQHYIDLLIRFGEEVDEIPRELQWISTHPASAERSEELQKILNDRSLPAFREFDLDAWESFKKKL